MKQSTFGACIRIFFWAILIVIGSRVIVPLPLIPITLQTCIVVLAGLVEGPLVGFAASLLYFTAGLCGLPVFASAGGGMAFLTYPSAGFVLAFPLGGALAGLAGRKAGKRYNMAWGFLAGLAAHVIILASGAIGLMINADVKSADAFRVQWSFMPGGVAKSAVAALIAALPFFDPGSERVKSFLDKQNWISMEKGDFSDDAMDLRQEYGIGEDQSDD